MSIASTAERAWRRALTGLALGALKPESAAQSTGSTAGCELTLYESPDTGWLYETYRLKS